jgi:hypothetical protein
VTSEDHRVANGAAVSIVVEVHVSVGVTAVEVDEARNP